MYLFGSMMMKGKSLSIISSLFFDHRRMRCLSLCSSHLPFLSTQKLTPFTLFSRSISTSNEKKKIDFKSLLERLNKAQPEDADEGVKIKGEKTKSDAAQREPSQKPPFVQRVDNFKGRLLERMNRSGVTNFKITSEKRGNKYLAQFQFQGEVIAKCEMEDKDDAQNHVCFLSLQYLDEHPNLLPSPILQKKERKKREPVIKKTSSKVITTSQPLFHPITENVHNIVIDHNTQTNVEIQSISSEENQEDGYYYLDLFTALTWEERISMDDERFFSLLTEVPPEKLPSAFPVLCYRKWTIKQTISFLSEAGVKRDSSIFFECLSQSLKVRTPEVADFVSQVAKEYEVPFTHHAVGRLIHIWVDYSQFEKCFPYLDLFSPSSQTSIALHYIVLKGYVARGMVFEARDFLKIMVKKGVPLVSPLEQTLLSLLICFNHTEAILMYKSMNKDAFETKTFLSHDIYHLMMGMCIGRKELFDFALEVLQDMKDGGSSTLPVESTYLCLINVCKSVGETEKMKQFILEKQLLTERLVRAKRGHRR